MVSGRYFRVDSIETLPTEPSSTTSFVGVKYNKWSILKLKLQTDCYKLVIAAYARGMPEHRHPFEGCSIVSCHCSLLGVIVFAQ